MNTCSLTAREIEALTFIFPESATPTPAVRKRGSGWLGRIWQSLRTRLREAAPASRAADWTFPGL